VAFAKLYGDGDDQILVKLDECLDGGQPEVRFYFQPPYHEAAKFAERDRETIRILFKKLKAEKLIYVADWRTDGHGPYVPLYALGNEKDEPMPPRQSNSVRSRLYRARRGAIPRPKDPILRVLLGFR
jgi:hypothetical protein